VSRRQRLSATAVVADLDDALAPYGVGPYGVGGGAGAAPTTRVILRT
jgi:hypothetical protein